MKHKKRILITIDWYKPGYKAGGPIQSIANLVAHLKEEFDFWIVTRNTDYNSVEPYVDVPADIWHRLEEGVQVYYFSASHLNYTSLKEVINGVAVDVMYINGIFSKYFSLMPLLIARKKTIPYIIAARGMFAPGAVHVKSGKKKVFFKLVKTLRLYKNATFHATNEAELEHIQHILGTKTKVVVAPNLPKVTALQVKLVAPKVKGELKLVSIARISPEKNTLFALEVLRGFSFIGNICFDIYGPVNDSAYWKQCESLIKELPANVRVSYRGSIASDLVNETLANYHALFLPTRGENFGHIILETLTSGLPVVISDQTPWKDLKTLQIGFDLPLEMPEEFASAIQGFLNMEQSEYNALSQRASYYAQEFIRNEAHITANKALFGC